MIDPSLTMTIIWLVAGALLLGSAALAWVTYCHTRYTVPYAFALASFAFGVVMVINAYIRSPWGYQNALQLIILQRSVFIMGAVLQCLAVDALAASYNGHRSMLRKVLAPLERWYIERNGEKDPWPENL